MAADAVAAGASAILYCKFCPSTILRPAVAELVEHKYALPPLPGPRSAGAAGSDGASETLRSFWRVKDKFDFENVGFTKTVDGHFKYLLCGECDIGPIGYYDLSDEASIYLACERVSAAPPADAQPKAVDPALLSMVEAMREAEDAKKTQE
ncbi:Mss4-like protein [Pavlovales sp. CCMP2436]|nr:Mss4-like protein [Pavlovales sp. CCMP2436]|mmetsp:Transcript_20126/g.51240  ORF Transcript_20126/g.51240 Transcript_20126/m.51240 type:complete len:151 (-) Transcript_20126:27-479(-)